MPNSVHVKRISKLHVLLSYTNVLNLPTLHKKTFGENIRYIIYMASYWVPLSLIIKHAYVKVEFTVAGVTLHSSFVV